MDAVNIRNLVKNYGELKAVKGISLDIKKGEFFGLLGPNGAGKTTSINILTGLASKSSGDVKIFGHDVEKEYKEARKYIGLVPQEFNMDIFATAYNMLDYNAGYHGLNKEKRKERVEYVLKKLNLWDKKDTKVRFLSGGMKRRVMIARALLHEPKILILDEPTAGVDVKLRKETWNLMQELNKEGITILLTTHYLEEAEELCNRIAIIDNGKIVVVDDKDNLINLMDKETITIQLEKDIKIPRNLLVYHPDPKVKETENKRLILTFHKKDYKKVLEEVAKLPLKSISTSKNKLEDVFLDLTERKK